MEYISYCFRKIKKFIKTYFSLTHIAIYFIIFFILLSIIFPIFEEYDINLNPNDYCNLTDVHYQAVLHDDPDGSAKVSITEYLTFDVHSASRYNPFKELWRELPEDIVDGVPITYNVKSVTQILEDGTEVPYTQTNKMFWEDYDYTRTNVRLWHHSNGSGIYPDNDESLLIYIPWTYREKLNFKIEYDMNNAALKYLDCSELYLSMYSGSSIKKLESYSADILIPSYLMPRSGCYDAYTFGTNKDRINFTESDTQNPGYHTFSMNLNKSDLQFAFHNRYLEFCLLAFGEDKHIFTQYAPDNLYTYTEALQDCIKENKYYSKKNIIYKNVKIIILGISLFLSSFAIIKGKRKYEEEKNENKFYEPEINYEYYRDIPSDLDPLFASKLVFIKDPYDENQEKHEELAAVLLNLVRKKYVSISKLNSQYDWSKSNILIQILQSPIQPTDTNLEPLTTTEKLYLVFIERLSTSYSQFTFKDLQTEININYIQTHQLMRDIEILPDIEIGVEQGYFQHSRYEEPKKVLLNYAKHNKNLGIFFLIIVNFISYFTPLSFAYGAYTILGMILILNSIYLKQKANNLILFTQFGENEYAKWRGLYNFLNSDTLINEKEVKDLPLWEKYLVYATAFGISEKIINALKIRAPELNLDHSIILNHHSFGRSIHFHSTSRSLVRTIHHSSHFGGHGGYGGGGRGGGGGGGGH